MSLLPQKEAVRAGLQPFRQETEPLAKIWCVKMKYKQLPEDHEDIFESKIQTLGLTRSAEN